MTPENRDGVCAPKGFQAGSVFAGIKPDGQKDDVAVLYCERPCTAAAVYTKNKVKADCLKVTREHLQDHQIQAVIINSGNANAAAPNGKEHALRMCEKTAELFHIPAADVAVASTGVIGQELPSDKIVKALDQLQLDADGSSKANRAIMTTDMVEKNAVVQFELEGQICTIGGICKGSGMIHPNMGTMLAFITTDVPISAPALEEALKKNVQTTFNRISVDGDTSTNDMVLCLASGLVPISCIEQDTPAFDAFYAALHQVMESLAIQIAADGEGASRLITVTVSQAKTEEQAETLARSVASSNLLKAAVFGSDANWGRVICAMGYSGADFDPDLVDITFGNDKEQILVCENGRQVLFDEARASRILSADSVEIHIALHEGLAEATCWGCDLTYEYVRINGDYRS